MDEKKAKYPLYLGLSLSGPFPVGCARCMAPATMYTHIGADAWEPRCKRHEHLFMDSIRVAMSDVMEKLVDDLLKQFKGATGLENASKGVTITEEPPETPALPAPARVWLLSERCEG